MRERRISGRGLATDLMNPTVVVSEDFKHSFGDKTVSGGATLVAGCFGLAVRGPRRVSASRVSAACQPRVRLPDRPRTIPKSVRKALRTLYA